MPYLEDLFSLVIPAQQSLPARLVDRKAKTRGRLLEAWKQSVGIDFVAQARDYLEQLPSWEQQQESTTPSR